MIYANFVFGFSLCRVDFLIWDWATGKVFFNFDLSGKIVFFDVGFLDKVFGAYEDVCFYF